MDKMETSVYLFLALSPTLYSTDGTKLSMAVVMKAKMPVAYI